MTNHSTSHFSAQSERILALVQADRGAWVPLPETIACAAQYNARVLELRRRGFNIENRMERVDGARHSWFRFVSSPPTTPPAPTFAKRPRWTGLPLFDLAVKS